MVRHNNILTTDEKIEELSIKKYNLLSTFINSVKEAAIDCELFKNHNMMTTSYECFKFNEESLFEENITGAYIKNIYNDEKMNNGLNSINSTLLKIKVYKITAVIKLGHNLFSNPSNYWVNFESNVVYDYHLNFPIGKLSKHDDLYNFFKDNVYIVINIINIPRI
jgi:hypothetical protein